MEPDFNSQIQDELSYLEADSKKLVLDYVRALRESKATRRDKKTVDFAGAISKDDVELMRTAIEAGCEQVDLDEW